MTERPPLEMTDAEMKRAHPTLGAKTQMVALEVGTYVRHGDGWVLLDAERHGYGSEAA